MGPTDKGASLLHNARRVAIIMLSAIGDAVHVLPIANALKQHRPDIILTWVIQPVPHALVAGHKSVDDFIVFNRQRLSETVDMAIVHKELANPLTSRSVAGKPNRCSGT